MGPGSKAKISASHVLMMNTGTIVSAYMPDGDAWECKCLQELPARPDESQQAAKNACQLIHSPTAQLDRLQPSTKLEQSCSTLQHAIHAQALSPYAVHVTQPGEAAQKRHGHQRVLAKMLAIVWALPDSGCGVSACWTDADGMSRLLTELQILVQLAWLAEQKSGVLQLLLLQPDASQMVVCCGIGCEPAPPGLFHQLLCIPCIRLDAAHAPARQRQRVQLVRSASMGF